MTSNSATHRLLERDRGSAACLAPKAAVTTPDSTIADPSLCTTQSTELPEMILWISLRTTREEQL